MKFNLTIRTFFTFLLLLFLTHTTLSGQPCTQTDVQCGVVEFTDFSIISTGHSGMGTAANPLIADQLEFKLCVDVQEYGETGLNYLHGVFVRNLPPNALVSNVTATAGHTASGEQAVTTPLVGVTEATRWIYVAEDDGLSTVDYPTNVATADGDGFVPHPGFFAVQALPDDNPRDNFGDPGQNQSSAGGFETYELVPFCFYITLLPPTDGSSNSWNPNVGISGDGSTGSHLVADPSCFIAGFFPSCGGSDGSGNVYYQAATNTGGGTPGACTANDAQCGSVDFTFDLISTGHTGLGTTSDPISANSVEFKLCADVTQYGETGLNYLHGVFVRNLPDGSSISNVSALAGNDPSGEQAVFTPAVGVSEATHWKYFAEDDGLAVADYPTNVAAVDGDGFIPYHGFYAVQSATDDNPRDNFGDPGQGSNISGASFESYILEPFCFYLTLVPPTDGSMMSWKPELGVSGDGSTGSHSVADPSCFIAGFFPGCGGSDQLGNVNFIAAASSGLALELTAFSATAEDRTNSINWTTTNDEDVARYVLEKSTTGSIFQTLTTTTALQKSTTQQYTAQDRSPALLTYYRLKAINVDGSVDYSEIIQVQRTTIAEQFTVYPTIFNDEVAVRVGSSNNQFTTVTVTDLTGKVIHRSARIINSGQRFTLDLAHATGGIYLLTIDTANEHFYQKLVKQ